MTRESRERLEQLRRQLHELYIEPLKNERKIDRIANQIRQIQEENHGD